MALAFLDQKYPLAPLPIGLSSADQVTLIAYGLDHRQGSISDDTLQYILTAEEIQFSRKSFYYFLEMGTESIPSSAYRGYYPRRSQQALDELETHHVKLIEIRDRIQAQTGLDSILDSILDQMACQIELIRTLITIMEEHHNRILAQKTPEAFLKGLEDLIEAIRTL